MALPLPDCDTPEVIFQLREVSPSLEVIIITALMDHDLLLKALLAGASGYLTKDISASEMGRCLQSFKRGELALTAASMSKAINLLVQRCRIQQAELIHYAGNGTKQNPVKPSELSLPHTVDATASNHISNAFSHLLTPQEEKVYQLMRQGQSNKQIAAQLAISPYTVGKHVQNILRKLGATNRTQAASYTSF
jgi:DNA-binding NarL/FixJ family response regulator